MSQGFNGFEEENKKTKKKNKGSAAGGKGELMKIQGNGTQKEQEMLKQLKAKGVSKGISAAGGVAFEVPSTSSKQTRKNADDDGKKKMKTQNSKKK